MSSPPHLWSYQPSHSISLATIRPEIVAERISRSKSVILSTNAVGFRRRRFFFGVTLTIGITPFLSMIIARIACKVKHYFQIIYTFFNKIPNFL